MTPAERVRYARQKRGLAQRELSRTADVSDTYVLMLERSLEEGRPSNEQIKEPGLEHLTKLAKALDVPVEWLAFGAGPNPFEGSPDPEGEP